MKSLFSISHKNSLPKSLKNSGIFSEISFNSAYVSVIISDESKFSQLTNHSNLSSLLTVSIVHFSDIRSNANLPIPFSPVFTRPDFVNTLSFLVEFPIVIQLFIMTSLFIPIPLSIMNNLSVELS